MAKMGRPLKEINKKHFEALCKMQCTEKEICDFFGCCEDTLNSWCKRNYEKENGEPMTFSETFEVKKAGGKISLRRKQWKLAETNAAMAIFLGKNYLGQSDKMDMNVDTSKGSVANVLDEYFKQRKSDNNSGNVEE